jgi:signal-transduction protein with cAMP-binding, CBS, and nucleotidyltransferase domain
MNIGEICTREVVMTDRASTLQQAATLMREQHVIGRLAEGKLAALPAAATVDEAIALMKERGVRRLLVSSEGGQLYGIVSLDDLFAALSHEMAELSRAVRKGIERETAERGKLPAAPPPRPVHIPAYSFT